MNEKDGEKRPGGLKGELDRLISEEEVCSGLFYAILTQLQLCERREPQLKKNASRRSGRRAFS